jgi:hypothetical protein
LGEVHPLADGGAEERAEHGGGIVVIGEEGAEGLAEVGDDLLEALVALVGGDAGAGDQEVLRAGAELTAVEGDGEGEVGEHVPVVAGGADDQGVDGGPGGEDAGLAGVFDQPRAERGGAGVVDEADLGANGQAAGHLLAGPFDGEADQVGGETGVGERVAGDPDGERERQDGGRMGFDEDRVARGQRGEQAGVAVPGREDAVGDHQGDPERYGRERLADVDDVVALRLAPAGSGGQPGLLGQGHGDGLQAPVLGVHGPRVEGHHGVVAAGVGGGQRELHAAGVDPVEDLRADRRPDLGAGVPPGGQRGRHRGQQHVGVGVRVGDAEFEAVRGTLAALGRCRSDRAVPAGLLQCEGTAEEGLEGGLTGGFGLGAVGCRVLRVRRPVFPRAEGSLCPLQKGAVTGDETRRHAATGGDGGDGLRGSSHDFHPCRGKSPEPQETRTVTTQCDIRRLGRRWPKGGGAHGGAAEQGETLADQGRRGADIPGLRAESRG